MIRLLLLAAFLCAGAPAGAAELRVVSSGGFAAALKTLLPEWERSTGNTVATDWGPSMGDTPNAIPQRLARGEPIDVVIMVGYSLDKLVTDGKVAGKDAVPLARSGIGVVVREGAPTPSVATPDDLKRLLLAAKSIAYSDSASGVYIQNEMFRDMGIQAEVAPKARMIPADPVGEIVARGEAEVGFQQISELKPIRGITLLGPVPPPLGRDTIFSAGILAGSHDPAAARALVAFLGSPLAATAITNSGMEPIGPPK